VTPAFERRGESGRGNVRTSGIQKKGDTGSVILDREKTQRLHDHRQEKGGESGAEIEDWREKGRDGEGKTSNKKAGGRTTLQYV